MFRKYFYTSSQGDSVSKTWQIKYLTLKFTIQVTHESTKMRLYINQCHRKRCENCFEVIASTKVWGRWWMQCRSLWHRNQCKNIKSSPFTGVSSLDHVWVITSHNEITTVIIYIYYNALWTRRPVTIKYALIDYFIKAAVGNWTDLINRHDAETRILRPGKLGWQNYHGCGWPDVLRRRVIGNYSLHNQVLPRDIYLR